MIYCASERKEAVQMVRYQDADEQKACYSGKKKRHTVKNVLLADGVGRVQFLRVHKRIT
jgi:hypothetical protein